MKSVAQLKNELLDDTVQPVYIFTGEEYGVRKHYIERISSYFKRTMVLDSMVDVYNELQKRSLIPVKTCYIVYYDNEYFKQKEDTLLKLFEIIKNNTLIIVMETLPSNKLFEKVFSTYVTNFTRITDVIMHKYIKEYLALDDELVEHMAYNIDNNYGLLLLEMDKIKMYSDDMSSAYKQLWNENMLAVHEELPTPQELADSFIFKMYDDLNYNIDIIKKLDGSILYYLPELYSTVLTLIVLQAFGKYKGGTVAYESGMYWGRVKQLREHKVSYNIIELQEMLLQLSELDKKVRIGKISNDYAFEWLVAVIM